MKRAREPLGRVGGQRHLTPENSAAETMAASSKRGRQPADAFTSSREAREEEERGPFRALLATGGVVWARNGSGVVVAERRSGYSCRCNPAKLRLFIEKALMHDHGKREEFVESLREFMAGPVQSLRRALLPLDCSTDHLSVRAGGGSSVIAAAAAASGSSSSALAGGVNAIHESLVKVLLRVDCIQPQVIDMLLEKLPELVAEEEEAEGGGAFAEDLPRLVLSQVRFLDHLVDSPSLTRKLLECVTVLPVGLQRDMISYLPEVVEDGDHAAVVETLQSLRESEPSLLVAVLDALGNLSLSSSLLSDITDDALGLLESAEPATLPVLLRFLLETATSETAEAVVREVREKLRLCPAGGGGATGAGRGAVGASLEDDGTEAPWMVAGKGSDDSGASGDALTLEALRQGLRLRADLAAWFIKDIAKTAGSQGHSVVDIWVLFCLHANQDTSKKVISLFRRKISLGHFTEALMADALHGRAGALHGVFHTLLGITDALVSSGASATRRYGGSMYKGMFMEFDEAYHRYEVVAALLTHVGAGSEEEADCALETLSSLAHTPDKSGGLRPFAAFIRGLLDYLQGLTHNQVRMVFRILCAMALPAVDGADNPVGTSASSAGGGSDLDDVHIFIRKHVAQSQMALKRIGIIGAVAFVEYQGKAGDAAANHGASLSQTSLASSNYGGGVGAHSGVDAAVQGTLTMLLNHCRSGVEGKAFLYDELALSAASGGLGSSALDTLVEMLSEPLENDFLNMPPEGTQQEGGEMAGKFSGDVFGGAVKARAFGDLNRDEVEHPTELLLLPLLASEDQQCRLKVESLCPLFSLIASCHRSPQSSSDLSEIDATLGAAMILADSQTVDNVALLDDSHKEAVIGAHVAACNWIRELINAFVLEPDNFTKSKLVIRVDHLCRLETDLLYMMKRCPGYRLPGRNNAAKNTSNGPPRPSSSSSSVPDLGGEEEGGNGQADDGAAGAGDPASGKGGKGKGKRKAAAKPKKAKKTEGEMSEVLRDVLRGSMRHLSPEAVLVLGFPGMLIKTRNTQGDTIAVEPVRVSLRGVHLMLQEMQGHLKRSLAPAKAMNPAFARLREAQSASGGSGNGPGTGSRPVRPTQEVLEMYHRGGVFRSLWSLLEIVGNSMQGIEESIGVISSGVDDEDMLFPCLELTLKVLSLLCGSDDLLGSGAGRALLRRCMQDMFSEDDQSGGGAAASSSSQVGRQQQGQQARGPRDGPDAFEVGFEKLEDFASTVQQLPLAVQLVQVMEAVATARVRVLAAESEETGSDTTDRRRRRDGGAPLTSLHHRLSTLCFTLLQRDWGGGDMKFIYKSSTLGALVRSHLRWAADPLSAIEVLSTEVVTLLLETGDCLGPAEGYPTLTAASFIHFFTPLLQALVTCWKDRTDFFARPKVPTQALLMRANRMILVFRLLVLLTKGNPSLGRRVVLVSALKEGKKMVQVFVRTMSVFEDAFESNQQDVLDIFTDLQHATRHMQALCAHGKQLGDAQMSKEAPTVKKLLEEFIFRVRFLAKSNDCLEALQVGRMMSRNIDGDKIIMDDTSDEEEEGDPEDTTAHGNGNGDNGDDVINTDSDADSEDDPGRANDRPDKKNDWSDTESD